MPRKFVASEWKPGMRVIDSSKYRTVPVRILCVDGPGEQPVVGIHDGTVCQWSSDGKFMDDGEDRSLDLRFADTIHPFGIDVEVL